MNISGHYVVPDIDKCYAFSYINYNSKKMKGRTESFIKSFLKLNDHPTRRFNFGLRRVHPNGGKFFFFFNISEAKPFKKLKQIR